MLTPSATNPKLPDRLGLRFADDEYAVSNVGQEAFWIPVHPRNALSAPSSKSSSPTVR